MVLTWDEYFMGIAEMAAKKSHCYSRQIGAVITRTNIILSTGYNGPPMGVLHCEARHPENKQKCPRRFKGIPSGQGLEMCPATHAEVNAIALAARNGICLKDSTLYLWTHDGVLPCKTCAGILINSGIIEVVTGRNLDYDSVPESIRGRQLFNEADVKMRCLDNCE